MDYPELPKALNNWLMLERPMTALPDLQTMKSDLALPVGQSMHGGKTAGHLNKARLLTMNGVAASGKDSLYLLARATNVWGKLVAGFVVKPRYLLAQDQDDFWREITSAPSDLTEEQERDALEQTTLLGSDPEEFAKLFAAADESSTQAMQAVHAAAISPESGDNIMPFSQDAQLQFYRLALGCMATQLDRTSGNMSISGIMEPGRDANAERVIPLAELLVTQL